MRTKRSHFMIAVLLAVGLLGIPAAALAQDGGAGGGGDNSGQLITTGGCKAPKVRAVTDNALGFSTASTGFVDVPGMAIAIGGGGCAIVHFSAFTFGNQVGSPGGLEMVRATIDGIPIPPGEFQLSGDDDEDGDGAWARQHSAHWALNVGAGGHLIKIQFRSFFAADTVFIHKPTMTVLSTK
jgi:hypothetical protein